MAKKDEQPVDKSTADEVPANILAAGQEAVLFVLLRNKTWADPVYFGDCVEDAINSGKDARLNQKAIRWVVFIIDSRGCLTKESQGLNVHSNRETWEDAQYVEQLPNFIPEESVE